MDQESFDLELLLPCQTCLEQSDGSLKLMRPEKKDLTVRTDGPGTSLQKLCYVKVDQQATVNQTTGEMGPRMSEKIYKFN